LKENARESNASRCDGLTRGSRPHVRFRPLSPRINPSYAVSCALIYRQAKALLIWINNST